MTSSSDRPLAPRVAPLAIVALILAMIPLCPPLNLIAVALGCVALRQVARASGSRRGRGAATAAVVIGLVVGGFGWWAWSDTAGWIERSFAREAGTVTNEFFRQMAGSEAPDPSAIADLWDRGRAPSQADLAAFAQALRSIGPLTGVQVDPPRPAAGMSSAMAAAVLLTTPEGRFNGGVTIRVTFGDEGVPTMQAGLTSVSVHLPEGDVELRPEQDDQ